MRRAPAEEIRSATAELGPVRAWLEVDPGRPRLSDEVTLRLVIDAEAGARVEPPRFGDVIADFRVLDFDAPAARLESGRTILEQEYVLEPLRSGPHVILPVPIGFVDERPEGDGQRHLLETESLTVEVTTLVGGDAPALAQLAPPERPVEVPEPAAPWLAWAIAGGAVLAALAAALAIRRARRRRERPLSPSEIAQRELEALLAANPFGRADLKGFYVELTLIVRRHVERTSGVRAPEQTTREFLRAIQGHPAFDELRRERLRAFLETADLVKFAGAEPESASIEASVERAREFIRLFAPAPPPLEPAR